jgi:hypothetical protein
VAVRHFGEQPLTNRAASMQPRHVRLGPGLVNKDDSLRINIALKAPPLRAPSGDVRPILLGRVQRFFYS